MNILILNGSPKGSNSITLQTLNYLQKYGTCGLGSISCKSGSCCSECFDR